MSGLTWRSSGAHLGRKVDKAKHVYNIFKQVRFWSVLNDSNPTRSANAAKTVAQSVRFCRPWRKWKTAFRLRLCEQIKGGPVQKTNRIHQTRLANQHAQDNLFVEKHKQVM